MKKLTCKSILFSLLTASVLVVNAEKKTNSIVEPVNIVLFVADDLGAADIGPYGNRIIRTPNLDKLADESLLFLNAFAGSPTCSPSRASMLTGMYPFRNGAHANHQGIKEELKTLPVYLQQADYSVGFAGKLHIGPLKAYPFELIHNTNVPESGHENDGVLWTDLNLEPVDKWLSVKSESKKPFLLVVNDHSPHVIWPEKSEYDDEKIDIPLIHIDTKETRIARARYYTDITKMDRNVGKLLESLKEYGLEKNTIVIFTADQGPQWAFGKWNLYDYGIRVPLIIRWPGVIQAHSENQTLVSLVDLLPTIVEIAVGQAPAETDGQSFLPELKGEKVSGRECVYATHTGDGTMNQAPMRMIRTNRYKYIVNLAPEVIYNTHINLATDHDGGYQYWLSWLNSSFHNEHAAAVLWRYHNRPKEELFDILSDPNEWHNLASNPYYEKVLEQFRIQMQEWKQKQGDTETGVFTETKKTGETLQYIFK
jgi:uncharacterized sulfatase